MHMEKHFAGLVLISILVIMNCVNGNVETRLATIKQTKAIPTNLNIKVI